MAYAPKHIVAHMPPMLAVSVTDDPDPDGIIPVDVLREAEHVVSGLSRAHRAQLRRRLGPGKA
jgi:hypothetical protein